MAIWPIHFTSLASKSKSEVELFDVLSDKLSLSTSLPGCDKVEPMVVQKECLTVQVMYLISVQK
jgi:hypothetical protein